MAEFDRQLEPTKGSEFEKQARRAAKSSGGPIGESWYLIVRTRKWWLVPVILALLGVGGFLILGGTAAAPLIYTVF